MVFFPQKFHIGGKLFHVKQCDGFYCLAEFFVQQTVLLVRKIFQRRKWGFGMLCNKRCKMRWQYFVKVICFARVLGTLNALVLKKISTF